jgi:hypothetical protein
MLSGFSSVCFVISTFNNCYCFKAVKMSFVNFTICFEFALVDGIFVVTQFNLCDNFFIMHFLRVECELAAV